MWEHADLKELSIERAVKESVYIFGDADITTQGELYSRGADTLAKLSRYERSIDKSLYKALHELQRLQAARKGKHPAPVVVDVEVTERSDVSSNGKQDPSEQ